MNSYGRIGRVLFLIAASVGCLRGEPAPVTGNASFGVLNRYIFRGYRLGRDSAVLQAGFSVAIKGFSVSFWGNIDTEEKQTPSFIPDRPGEISLNEIDLALTYTQSLRYLDLTAGFIYYGTKYVEKTQELFFGAAFRVFGKPAIMVYRDMGAYPGTYANFSLSHSLPLGQGVTVDLGVSAAYFGGDSDYWQTYELSTRRYSGKLYRAFHDGMAKAILTIPVEKNLSLQILAQYYFPLSGDAKKTIGGRSYNINGNLEDAFVVGSTVIFIFQ